MLARAADAGAGVEGTVLAHWNRRVLQRMPVRNGFLSDVLHQAQPDVVVEFVHRGRVVRGFARAATLEDGDGLRCFRGNCLGHKKAGPAPADDGDVHGFEISHDSSLGSLRRGYQVPRRLSGSTRNSSRPGIRAAGAAVGIISLGTAYCR